VSGTCYHASSSCFGNCTGLPNSTSEAPWAAPAYTSDIAGFGAYCASWSANAGVFNGDVGLCPAVLTGTVALDFTTGILPANMVDISTTACPEKQSGFEMDPTMGNVYRVELGTGFYIPGITDKLGGKVEAATEYTIRMVLKLDKNTGWNRILNVNPGSEDGLYIHGGYYWYPSGTGTPASPTFPANEWHSVTISTGPDQNAAAYFDGGSKAEWLPHSSWASACRIRTSSLDVMMFFNDGASVSSCHSGGEHTGGHVKSIQVFNERLTDAQVAQLEVDSPVFPPAPSPLILYPEGMNAWYCPGAFDLASSNTWQDCSGNGNTATLSGSGLAESHSAGHGATNEVLALSGTTSSVISFGAIIASTFTVCSVTRYTGGTKGRILQGGGGNWLHGHYFHNGWGYAMSGVAYYGDYITKWQNNVSPDTDWVVMCGSNAGSQLKLVNGVDVGPGGGSTGGVSLFVNAGDNGHEKSDFAIAEVVVWPRGLTDDEMRSVSEHMMNRLG
jgi:hypothetical protein